MSSNGKYNAQGDSSAKSSDGKALRLRKADPDISMASQDSPVVTPGTQQAYLEIEGGQEVFYRGSYVTKIPLKSGTILIGRRDVMAGHYPDIDLVMYRKLDPAISRRHMQIYRDVNGKYFVEDLCNNNATFLNDYSNKLNHERRELTSGDRIFVSSSISILFKIVD